MLPRGITTPRRQSFPGHIACLILALLAVALPAAAQPAAAPQPPTAAPADPATPPPAQQIDAPFVDWSHAQHAFRLIEGWVRRGKAERDPKVKPVAVTGLVSARVTLRWLGKTMGTGEAGPADLNDSRPIDLVEVVRQATERALADTAQTLKDRQTAARKPNEPERPAINLRDIGSRLLADLQLAHDLEQVHVPAGADELAIYDQFAPGFHGLRMTRTRADNQTHTAWIWPASALASNIAPHRQLVQLLSGVGLSFDELGKVGRPGGPAIERFEVIHLVRPTQDLTVSQLVRGNTIVPAQQINEATLDAMAQRLTRHLVRRQREDGSMAGTYLPTSDQYDPIDAPSHDVALAAYALGRRAAVLLKVDPNAAEAGELELAVRRTALYLNKLIAQENNQARIDAPTYALLLLTLIETPQMGDFKIQRDWLAKALLALRSPRGDFKTGLGKDDKALNHPTQALIVSALASMYEQSRADPLKDAVTTAQQLLWQEADTGQVLSMMPWLVTAESRMRRLGAGPQDDAAVGQRDAAMRSLLDLLKERQVTETPMLGPADVLGGFDLATKSPDSPPRPDWRTGQALAFMAIALRDPRLTPPVELPDRLMRTGLAARFIAQLMMDEPGCFYVRSMDDALGGVRPTLWQNELSVAPTALALLAVTELQQSLRDLPPLEPRK
jgi:hypothetical protein